jgi:hypothetical protein
MVPASGSYPTGYTGLPARLAYGVDASLMHTWLRGGGIHIVSAAWRMGPLRIA